MDAIGAVGIARCFTFGGAKKRALYGEKDIEAAATQMEYPGDCPEMVSAKDGATLMHFFDKLFHLKDKMKTEKGREMAEKRHQVCSSLLGIFQETCLEGRIWVKLLFSSTTPVGRSVSDF